MKPQTLIAGIGNIFMGDDAFGVEVIKALQQSALPEAVNVVDFGIRGYDLAFALTEGYDAVVFVDALPRGEVPGTIYLLELDIDALPSPETSAPDAHSLDPVGVLRLARSLGGITAKLFLVGCEPAVIETDQLGLSEPVHAAVPRAVTMIEQLVSELLAREGACAAERT